MLLPCANCMRHVRIDAERCPFCRSSRTRSTMNATTARRLSRAALFLAAIGEVGCAAVYGAPPGPPFDDSGADVPSDVSFDIAMDTQADAATDASDVGD